MNVERSQGYNAEIWAKSPRDARLYRWLEQGVMVCAVGTVVAFGVLLNEYIQRRLQWHPRMLIVAVFPIAGVVCAWLYRRIARKYGFID